MIETAVEVTEVREVRSPGPERPAAVGAARSRRTRVERHPGVYYRETAAGRRYEISWLDAEGRRRWRTVGGGLRDAQAALEDERRKTRRGERTAPAQAPRLAEYTDAWLERKGRIRERTRHGYECRLRVPESACSTFTNNGPTRSPTARKRWSSTSPLARRLIDPHSAWIDDVDATYRPGESG